LLYRERQLTQLTDLGKEVLPMPACALASAEASASQGPRSSNAADLSRLPDGLRRELWRGDVNEYVGIERLHLDRVRVDGRLGHLIGVFGNDHRRSLGAEAILQAFEVILAVVVVLVENGDLAFGFSFKIYLA
jgi:hypothetical protein